jgi:hypothetical protein
MNEWILADGPMVVLLMDGSFGSSREKNTEDASLLSSSSTACEA